MTTVLECLLLKRTWWYRYFHHYNMNIDSAEFSFWHEEEKAPARKPCLFSAPDDVVNAREENFYLNSVFCYLFNMVLNKYIETQTTNQHFFVLHSCFIYSKNQIAKLHGIYCTTFLSGFIVWLWSSFFNTRQNEWPYHKLSSIFLKLVEDFPYTISRTFWNFSILVHLVSCLVHEKPNFGNYIVCRTANTLSFNRISIFYNFS